MFADKLGSTSGIDFGSAQKSLAKCPADPPASGTWQRKSSILGRLVITVIVNNEVENISLNCLL